MSNLKKVTEHFRKKPRTVAIDDALWDDICQKVMESDYNSVSDLVREACERLLWEEE